MCLDAVESEVDGALILILLARLEKAGTGTLLTSEIWPKIAMCVVA